MLCKGNKVVCTVMDKIAGTKTGALPTSAAHSLHNQRTCSVVIPFQVLGGLGGWSDDAKELK